MKTHKINENDVKIAVLETTINNINSTLIRFEKRFDKIDERFDRTQDDIKELRKDIFDKFDIESKYVSRRSWIQFGFLFGMITSILTIVAKTKGWL